jgi:hypothetical protein
MRRLGERPTFDWDAMYDEHKTKFTEEELKQLGNHPLQLRMLSSLEAQERWLLLHHHQLIELTLASEVAEFASQRHNTYLFIIAVTSVAAALGVWWDKF